MEISTELPKDLPILSSIVKVFYPVLSPDKNADETICWLKNHSSRQQTQVKKLA
jgi:hypothetical protein